MVFGGAGSIGSELVRQLAPKNEVFIFDIDETRTFDLYEELERKGYEVDYRIGDIRNADLVENIIASFAPDIIFHAAAYKHVTPMDRFPREATTTNIIGTLNIINGANCIDCKLVNISTDKVVNANCVMGATKKVSEIIVKNCGGVSVRFGNVLGSRGSVIPIWQQQIDKGEPLTVTDTRMERFMMTIPQACELLIEACQKAKKGEIWIMDMGEKVNILALAKAIIGKRDIQTKIIGMRPGETLDEKLMSNEESERAIKSGKFWIIK